MHCSRTWSTIIVALLPAFAYSACGQDNAGQPADAADVQDADGGTTVDRDAGGDIEGGADGDGFGVDSGPDGGQDGDGQGADFVQ